MIAVLRLLLILLVLAAPAAATQDGWPALHDVVGVAPDDVLNIRSGPGASFPIVGTLAPGATGVEVIGPSRADGDWGLVNVAAEGGIGYVSLRFLRRQPNTFAGHLPPVLACYGTEPFWGLAATEGAMVFEDASFGETYRTGGFEAIDTGRYGAEPVLRGREGPVAITVVIENRVPPDGIGDDPYRALCTDGMSDRVAGVAATVIVDAPGRTSGHYGCCSFQAE